jgi:hypothetical protein
MMSPSIRTIISCKAARTIRLRVADVAAECDQGWARSAPSCISCCRSASPSGVGFLASNALAFDPVLDEQRLVPAPFELATRVRLYVGADGRIYAFAF